MTRPVETPLRQIVGAAVVDSLQHPTRLLVARRTAPPQFAGMWEFPGGKVEAGETCQEALLRELGEELGIEARLGLEIPGPHPQGWPLSAAAAMRVWLAESSAGEAARPSRVRISRPDCPSSPRGSDSRPS